jgi:hypothetical protein
VDILTNRINDGIGQPDSNQYLRASHCSDEYIQLQNKPVFAIIQLPSIVNNDHGSGHTLTESIPTSAIPDEPIPDGFTKIE